MTTAAQLGYRIKMADKAPVETNEAKAKRLMDTDTTSGMIADFLPGFGGSRRAGQAENMAKAVGHQTAMATHHPWTSQLTGGLGGGLVGALLGGGLGATLGARSRAPGSVVDGALLGAGLGGGLGAIHGGIVSPGMTRRDDRAAIQKAYLDKLNAGESVAPVRPDMDDSWLSPYGAVHRAGQADMYGALKNNEKLPGAGQHLSDFAVHGLIGTGGGGLVGRAITGMAHDNVTNARLAKQGSVTAFDLGYHTKKAAWHDDLLAMAKANPQMTGAALGAGVGGIGGALHGYSQHGLEGALSHGLMGAGAGGLAGYGLGYGAQASGLLDGQGSHIPPEVQDAVQSRVGSAVDTAGQLGTNAYNAIKNRTAGLFSTPKPGLPSSSVTADNAGEFMNNPAGAAGALPTWMQGSGPHVNPNVGPTERFARRFGVR